VVDNGPDWYEVRSKTQQYMMRPTSAFYYTEKVQQVAKEFVAHVERNLNDDGFYPLDMVVDLHTFAFEATALFALDYKLGVFNEDANDYAKHVVGVNDTLSEAFVQLAVGNIPFYKWLPNPRWQPVFRKAEDAMSELTEMCLEKVNEAKERILKNPKAMEDASVLEKMIIRNGPDSFIPPITAMDMLFGGIDSSGNTAAFLLYHLAT